MISVQTDMSLPKDFDHVGLQVSMNGVTQFADEYQVGPGNLLIPATFGVVQGSDPSQALQIRVVARKAGQLVVLRDVTTTVPSGRLALLRMPIEFLCQGQAADGPASSGDVNTQDQTATSTCGAGMTCVAGACVTTTIDSSTLPPYNPAQIFGGASGPGSGGQCLDTVGCFAAGYVASVTSTPTDCSIAKPAGGAGVNVAMASGLGSAGICGTQACLVPLDDAPVEGWTDEGNGRLALPHAVCDRIASNTIDSVVVTTACATKTPATPTCGPWSAVQGEPGTFEGGAPDGAATPIADGGADATLGAGDGGIEDASAGSDGATSDCVALVAAIQSAAITPPAGWINLDLSNGAGFNGTFADAGVPIDGTGFVACASYVEPLAFSAGSAPQNGGSRAVVLGGATGTVTGPVVVSYNVQSRLIDLVVVNRGAASTLSFHSRAGGHYLGTGGTPYQYVIGLGANTDGGLGYVTRNGVDFPLAFDDAGAPTWANEIYDGLMATFDPSVTDTTPDGGAFDCTTTPLVPFDGGVNKRAPACLDQLAPTGSGPQYLGVRPLGLYLGFDAQTNHVNQIYQFWNGATPSCGSTPQAAIEAMDYSSIQAAGNFNAVLGPTWFGTSIGNVSPAEVFSSAQGLLEGEATQLLCNGTTAIAPDPGYDAIQWGSQGEVLLEYEPTGLSYRLFAKAGYKGLVGGPPGPPIVSVLTDGGTGNTYAITPGTLTVNGAPISLNWAGGVAALTPQITDISNAWVANWCGATAPDTNCVTQGDCAIVPTDAQGNSHFTLLTSATVTSQCGVAMPPLTVTFPQGSSVPSSISTENLAAGDGG